MFFKACLGLSSEIPKILVLPQVSGCLIFRVANAHARRAINLDQVRRSCNRPVYACIIFWYKFS